MNYHVQLLLYDIYWSDGQLAWATTWKQNKLKSRCKIIEEEIDLNKVKGSKECMGSCLGLIGGTPEQKNPIFAWECPSLTQPATEFQLLPQL
jgi:hypothetical protein